MIIIILSYYYIIGRFDAGMLYYSPQIWCSDNTDAIVRMKIQYGTSLAYPTRCVGSHISCGKNHIT
jgi:alpha-galactosidase